MATSQVFLLNAGRPHLLQIGVISGILIMWSQRMPCATCVLQIGFAIYNGRYCI